MSRGIRCIPCYVLCFRGGTAFGGLQPRRRIGRGPGVARQWMVWSCRDTGVARCSGATVGGVDASRLVMVSSPRGWLATVAALVEELDVVYACAPPVMSVQVSRRLATRLRARRSTLVICGGWPSAVTHIDVRTIGWWKPQQAGHSAAIHEVEVTVTRHHWSRSVVLARDDRGVHGFSSELAGGVPA